MKNLSNKTNRELAELYAASFVRDFDPQAFFDAGVRLGAIYPLALCCADPGEPPDPIVALLEDGHLDALFSQGNDADADALAAKGGFLVEFECQHMDFGPTVFSADGEMDHCESSGWGYYRIYHVWGETLEAAYAAVKNQYIAHVEADLHRASQSPHIDTRRSRGHETQTSPAVSQEETAR